MNPIEKIRQKQAQRATGAAPALMKPAQPAPAQPAPKPAPAIVKHSCGHEKPLADLTSRPCPACREKAAQAKRAKHREKAADRKAAKGLHDTHRLPDGAAYHKSYDAAAMLWTVTLTIPGSPGFTAQGSGSVRSEINADRMYREWLDQQKRAQPGTVGKE